MTIGSRIRDAIAAPTKPTAAMTPTSNMMDVVSTIGPRILEWPKSERGRSRFPRENQDSHPGPRNRRRHTNRRCQCEGAAPPRNVREELYYAAQGSAPDGGRLARLVGRGRPPATRHVSLGPDVGRSPPPDRPLRSQRACADAEDQPAP